MDGWGKGVVPSSDAIRAAETPFVDSLCENYPNAELITYGEDVGLPEGQMGNSEVGHLNIGAGRVVYQELARINIAIREKELNKNEVLLNALHYAKKNNKPVHLLGLVSDGGVHSHINHLKALCDITQEQGLENVFIHAFTDGRDCDPKSGVTFMSDLQNYIAKTPIKIASIVGRYYAMDRDKRWERVKVAYDLLVHGIGEGITNIKEAITHCYEQGVTDEFLPSLSCINESGNPIAVIKPDDVVISFNFRTDRPREITSVLSQKDYPEWGMTKLSLYYVTMTRYDETFKNIEVIFTKDDVSLTLGEVLSKAGRTQVRIAETEKYPHVTFFFSGGREEEFEGEKRIMIPSPKVATYDLKPEMSANEIVTAITNEIVANQPDFICLNFANTDMVGHTGVFKAAMVAAETVDTCVKRIVEVALGYDYDFIIIADHGNSDYMINEDGTPNTAHTKNKVPIIYVSKSDLSNTKIKNGRLADVAPTLLYIMGIEKPSLMDGNNLIERG